MKNLFLFFILIFFFTISKAQIPPFDWSISFGKNSKVCSPQLDKYGNIYLFILGDTTADLNPGPAYYTTNNRESIVKLDKYGNFLWAIGISEWRTTNAACNGFTIDSNGSIYLLARLSMGLLNVDFDPGPGVLNMNYLNGSLVFVKLNSSGQLIFAKQFGPSYAYNLNLDNVTIRNSSIYFYGAIPPCNGDFDPSSGVYNLNTTGGGCLISKIDTNGNLAWLNFFPKSNFNFSNTHLNSIAFGTNCIYAIGMFMDTLDFDPSPAINLIPNPLANGPIQPESLFILKMDLFGNMNWVKILPVGTSDDPYNYFIETDKNENIYIVGLSTGTVDFDLGPGVFNYTVNAGQEKFILKMDSAANLIWLRNFVYSTSNSANSGENVMLRKDLHDNFYIVSFFDIPFDMDPGPLVKQSEVLASNYIKIDLNGNYQWSMSFDSCIVGGIIPLSNDSLFFICNPGLKNLPIDLDPGSGIVLSDTLLSKAYLVKLATKSIGIDNFSTQNETIQFYPNPFQQYLNINIAKNRIKKIQLVNLNGDVMQIWKNENRLDLSHIKSGVYFLSLFFDDAVFTSKIIKD